MSAKKKTNAPKGMILLKRNNRILEETVRAQIFKDPEEKKASLLDIKLCDFDEVSYAIKIGQVEDGEDAAPLTVTIDAPCYDAIKDQGAEEHLQEVFGDMIADEGLDGGDVTINVDLGNLPSTDEKKEALVQKLANFKFSLMSGPFRKYFAEVSAGTNNLEPLKYNLRSDTTVFICPKADRCTVVFGIDFQEKVDKTLAGVFLQELVDANRRVRRAPVCSWNINPPSEVKSETSFGVSKNPGILGFISFAVMASHCKPAIIDETINALVNFRTFLQYHIKCAKSYFHSRMRSRCTELLKVLNRAKVKFGVKVKKTTSGKTFKRN